MDRALIYNQERSFQLRLYIMAMRLETRRALKEG